MSEGAVGEVDEKDVSGVVGQASTAEDALNKVFERKAAIVQGMTSAYTAIKECNEFPVSRVKKIVKADEEVRMIGVEVPFLLAFACEMLVSELSVRSLFAAKNSGRRELSIELEDLEAVIRQTEYLDFLVDVVDGTIKQELAEQDAKRAAAKDD